MINTGVNPAGMAITPNNKYLFVANNNNYSIANQDSITVINLKSKRSRLIHDEAFNQPYTITINEEGTKAYVTNSGASTISVINLTDLIVTNVIDGFDGPSGMVIHKNIGYVNNYGATPGVGSGNGKTVRMVDLETNTIIGSPIEVGLAPAAITKYGKYIYTANYETGNPNTGTISKINTCDKTVTTIGPFEKGFSGPFAIVIKHSKIYLTNFGSNNFEPFGNTLSIYDLKTGKLESIELGIQPSGLAISKDGKYAYVSNYNTLYAYVQPDPLEYLNLTAGQGTVNIVDLEKKKVVKTIPVGQSPSYVSISPNGKYLYVSNYTSNTVNIFDINELC